MTPRHASRVAAALVAALTGWAALAPPASATVHAFDTEAVSAQWSGLLKVDELPDTGAPSLCPRSSTFSGTIDDATATDNITGTFTWVGPTIGLFDPADLFQEVFTGTSTGNAAGDFDPATGRFTRMRFPDMTVSIYRLDINTCERIETMCTYDIDGFRLRGRLRGGATLPLTSPEQLAVSGRGEIDVDASCPPFLDSEPPIPFPVTVPLTLGANPNDPAGYNRAIYQQV